MASPKTIYNSTALACALEAVYANTGIRIDPDFVTYQLDPLSGESFWPDGTRSQLIVTARATSSDGRIGIYSGQTTFKYARATLTEPRDMVYSDTYPMTFDRLRTYLKASYDFLIEDGDFYIVGDSSHTPLVSGDIIGVVPDSVTHKIQLAVASTCTRWAEPTGAGEYPYGQISLLIAGANSQEWSAPLLMNDVVLPEVITTQPFHVEFTAHGGTLPYTWRIMSGQPPGPIDPDTGIIDTASVSESTDVTWVVRVTDAKGRFTERTYTAPVTILPLELIDDAPASMSYVYGDRPTFSIAVKGGVPPYTYEPDGSYGNQTDVFTKSISSEGLVTLAPLSDDQIVYKITDSANHSVSWISSVVMQDRDTTEIAQSVYTKLLAWYGFDEGSANDGDVVYDRHVHGYHLKVSEDGCTLIDGRDLGAFSFSGQYVTDTSPNGLFAFSGDFTVLGWQRFSKAPIADMQIVGQLSADKQHGWTLGITYNMINTQVSPNLYFKMANESGVLVGGGVQNNFGTTTGFSMMGISRVGKILVGSFEQYNAMKLIYTRSTEAAVVETMDQPLTFGGRLTDAVGDRLRGDLDDWAVFNNYLELDEQQYLHQCSGYAELYADAHSPVTPLVITGDLVEGSLDAVYGGTLQIDGGISPYARAWVYRGQIPDGLTLTYSGSTISLPGTPTVEDDFDLTIAVRSKDGQVATYQTTITIKRTWRPDIIVDLPLNGINGSTDFIDTTGRQWSELGSAGLQISTAVDAEGAAYFPGTNQYLITELTRDFFVVPGFELDVDFYPQKTKTFLLSSSASSSPIIAGLDSGADDPGTFDGNYPYFGWLNADNSFTFIRSPIPATLNQWNSMKVVWEIDNTMRMFMDKQCVIAAQITDIGPQPGGDHVIQLGRAWGSDTSASSFYQGYMRKLHMANVITYDTLDVVGEFIKAYTGVPYVSRLPILGGNGVYTLRMLSGTVPDGLTLEIIGYEVVLSGTSVSDFNTAFTFAVDSSDTQTSVESRSVQCVTLSTYALSVLQDQPVAYWQADEISGPLMYDLTGNEHHATYNEASSVSRGTAPLRAGANGSVSISENGWAAEIPTFTPNYSEWSLETVVKRTTQGGGVLSQFFGGQGSLMGTTQVRLSYRPVSVEAAANGINIYSPAVTGLTPTHVIFESTGDALNLYENGRLVQTHIGGSPLTLNGMLVFLGSGVYPDSYGFHGSGSDFAVYDHALGASRALTHAVNAGLWLEDLGVTGTFDDITIGVPYSKTVTLTGGNGVYSVGSITAGTLPSELTLSVVNDQLTLAGTLTSGDTELNFTTAINSADGQSVNFPFTIPVKPGLAVTVVENTPTWLATVISDENGDFGDPAPTQVVTAKASMPGGGYSEMCLAVYNSTDLPGYLFRQYVVPAVDKSFTPQVNDQNGWAIYLAFSVPADSVADITTAFAPTITFTDVNDPSRSVSYGVNWVFPDDDAFFYPSIYDLSDPSKTELGYFYGDTFTDANGYDYGFDYGNGTVIPTAIIFPQGWFPDTWKEHGKGVGGTGDFVVTMSLNPTTSDIPAVVSTGITFNPTFAENRPFYDWDATNSEMSAVSNGNMLFSQNNDLTAQHVAMSYASEARVGLAVRTDNDTVGVVLDANGNATVSLDGINSWKFLPIATFLDYTNDIEVKADTRDLPALYDIVFRFTQVSTGNYVDYKLISDGSWAAQGDAHGNPSFLGFFWRIFPGTVDNGNTIAANTTVDPTSLTTYLVTEGTSPATEATYVYGEYQLRITATRIADVTDTTTLNLHVLVLQPPSIEGTFDPAFTSTNYQSDVQLLGGDGTYSNPRATSGTLPSWATLSIVGDKLRLSGSPTVDMDEEWFDIAVDSGNGTTATSSQPISVSTINPVTSWLDSFNAVSGSGVFAYEYNGDLTDDSGNGYNATLSGGNAIVWGSNDPAPDGGGTATCDGTQVAYLSTAALVTGNNPFFAVGIVKVPPNGWGNNILWMGGNGSGSGDGTFSISFWGTGAAPRLCIDFAYANFNVLIDPTYVNQWISVIHEYIPGTGARIWVAPQGASEFTLAGTQVKTMHMGNSDNGMFHWHGIRKFIGTAAFLGLKAGALTSDDRKRFLIP